MPERNYRMFIKDIQACCDKLTILSENKTFEEFNAAAGKAKIQK